VGSYPTFSPLPNELDRKRRAFGFASGLPQRCKRHRRFIFCGTIRSRTGAHRFRETHCAAPWRYQARCPFAARSCEVATMESGLSSRPLPLREADRRSPGSPAVFIIRGARGCHNRSPRDCHGMRKTRQPAAELRRGQIHAAARRRGINSWTGESARSRAAIRSSARESRWCSCRACR
jgi:hypothetical protein